MSARIVDAASITVPLLAKGLDAPGITADGSLAKQVSEALGAFAAAVRIPPVEG